MELYTPRLWILLLCSIALTACPSNPPVSEKLEQRVESTSIPQDDVFRQLRSEKPLDRISALQSLSKQPQLARKAISLILVLLADDRQVDVARYVGSGFYNASVTSPAAMASELLARLGRWSVLPLRLRLLDPNPVIRRYAVKSLGIMVNPEHVEWLLLAMKDESAAVSKEAYAALIKQDPQVYVKVIDKIDLGRMSVRQNLLLIQLLGHSRHGDALPALFRFAKNPDPALRSASFVAMSKFPEARLDEIVLQGIQDSNLQVRENALLLAPQQNNPAILNAVFSQISVPDAGLRQTLLNILPVMTGQKPRSVEAWKKWWQINKPAH